MSDECDTKEVAQIEKKTEIVKFDPLSTMPSDGRGKLEMAKIIAESGLAPQGLNTPQKVFIALQWGHELQLSPMVAVNNIAVVNGRPSLSADIMHAIVRNNPEYGGIKWLKNDNTAAECVITRRNGQFVEETRGYFDMAMANAAGLAGKDNWKKYPARMLKHRALSFALRDSFPDVLAGIYSPDELENIPPVIRNVTPMQTMNGSESAIADFSESTTNNQESDW